MSDFITRGEFEARDAQRARELAAVESRVTAVEASLMVLRDLTLFFREELPRRFDDADRARDAQTAELMKLVQDMARFKRYEAVAFHGLRLAVSLPLLKWARKVLGWALALLGGAGAGVVFVQLVSLWR